MVIGGFHRRFLFLFRLTWAGPEEHLGGGNEYIPVRKGHVGPGGHTDMGGAVSGSDHLRERAAGLESLC